MVVKDTASPLVLAEDGSLPPGSDAVRYDLDGVHDESCTTADVYQRAARPLGEQALAGVNVTMLCYGQTGSGKTHTMLGEESSPGLAFLAAEHLLASPSAPSIFFSFCQIYEKVITDLLPATATGQHAPADPTAHLKVRSTADAGVVVEDLVAWPVSELADIHRLVSRGSAARISAGTALNSTSSRSHAVLTFYIETSPSDTEVLLSKLHLVDLAGSERVKDSEVTGTRLREAININLSLFNLSRVISALGNKKKSTRVPYSDDVLCSLLRDALGGNSRTAFIATVSPASTHASETSSTLGFACSCRRVTNRPTVNRISADAAETQRQRQQPWRGKSARGPSRTALAAASRAAAAQLPWAGVCHGDPDRCPGGRLPELLPVSLGPGLSIHSWGDAAAAPAGTALLLHGYPSSSEHCWGNWLVPALVHSGFRVLALDMPGCGASQGTPLRTRSEFNLDAGGPCSVVAAVLAELCIASATIIGVDWGGGIACSLASSRRYNALCDAIVLIHPSYQEVEKGELRRVQCPVMVLWAKDDAFHSYSKWRPNIETLREGSKKSRRTFAAHIVPRTADVGWRSSEREQEIVRFLTGVDPLPSAQTLAAKMPEEAAASVGGGTAVAQQAVLFHGDERVRNLQQECAPGWSSELEREACAKLASLNLPEVLQTAAFGSGYQRQGALRTLRDLPLLGQHSVTARRLRDCGLWSAAAASACEGLAALCAAAPRYFRGRRVLGPERTFGALRRMCDGHVEVASQSGLLSEREDAFLLRNQRHELPSDGDVVCLEDGLTCDYSSPLARGVMARIARALCPLAEELGQLNALRSPQADERRTDVQLRCVQCLRDCLDLTTFQRAGGERGTDPTRDYGRCMNDAARFAVRGEGHCHTVTSVMCAFLTPFAPLLGLDMAFREDGAQSHQWCEVTCRPAMDTYVVDLYREDGRLKSGANPRGPSLLRLPAAEAYGHDGDQPFPADTPKTLTGRRLIVAALEPADVMEDLRTHSGDG